MTNAFEGSLPKAVQSIQKQQYPYMCMLIFRQANSQKRAVFVVHLVIPNYIRCISIVILFIVYALKDKDDDEVSEDEMEENEDNSDDSENSEADEENADDNSEVLISIICVNFL